jgi:hypothetical protein
VTMIEVVERGRKKRAGAVRFSIGRKSSGTGPGCIDAHALGNPFGVKPHGPYTREESITKYEVWLEAKILRHDDAVCASLNEIWRAAKQGSVELECFCKPLACHGDVVKRVVEDKL